MKYLIIGLIKLYQLTPGPWHGYCKHIPSCSNYMMDSIIEFGLLKGGFLGTKRLLRCNPFNKGGYDPVKKEG